MRTSRVLALIAVIAVPVSARADDVTALYPDSAVFAFEESKAILLRLEGFNLFNHGNFLGRGVTTFGPNPTAAPTFGQFVTNVGTAATAIPAFANIDPPRMFQLQAKFVF